MASTSVIAPSTAITMFILPVSVTDTHCKVRLALRTLQEYLNLKLGKMFKRFQRITKSDAQICRVCTSVRSSAWNISVSIGRIFVKFDVSSFF
jgi:hypothetical protein